MQRREGAARTISMLAGLAFTLACSAAEREPAEPRAELRTAASAEIRVPPDLARISLGVRNEASEAEAALASNSERMKRLLAALRKHDLRDADLQTSGARLQPRFSRPPREAGPDWQPEVIGYVASNRIEVRTRALARVGQLIADATSAGANELRGVQFELTDDAAARERAIVRATERALTEARALAGAANVLLDRITRLELDPEGAGRERHEVAMGARALGAERDAMQHVPVEPGEITVRAQVRVTFEIRPEERSGP